MATVPDGTDGLEMAEYALDVFLKFSDAPTLTEVVDHFFPPPKCGFTPEQLRLVIATGLYSGHLTMDEGRHLRLGGQEGESDGN